MSAPPRPLLLGVGVGEGAGLRGRLHGAVAMGGCSTAVLWGGGGGLVGKSWEPPHSTAGPPTTTHLQWDRGWHWGVRWEEGSRQGGSRHILGGEEVSVGLGVVGGSGGVAAGGVLTVPVLPRERWPSCWARGATTEGWRGTAWSTAGASTAPCMAPSISKGGGQQEGWGEQGHGVGDTGGQGQQWDVGLRCAGWGPRGRAGGV